jgi:hypothetical protein
LLADGAWDEDAADGDGADSKYDDTYNDDGEFGTSCGI